MPVEVKDSGALENVLTNIKSEFDNVEAFVTPDTKKCERFKTYLKKFYDFVKVNEEDISSDLISNEITSAKSKQKRISSVPELIVDTGLVDTEQIYQQLQLYNTELDSASSINNLTKFFSKSLLAADSISFNVNKAKTQSSMDSDAALGTTTDNFDGSNDGEDEDDYDLSEVFW